MPVKGGYDMSPTYYISLWCTLQLQQLAFDAWLFLKTYTVIYPQTLTIQ